MSRLAGHVKLVIVVVAATMSMASYATAQEGLATPQAFAAAKNGSVEQFAAALAEAGTPVGVVLLQHDVRARTNPLTVEREAKAMTPEATISTFEARYPEYRIERAAGGVVIAPRMAGWCSRPLRSRLKSLTANGEAFEVIHRIVRTWSADRSPYIPPGIVGREGQRRDLYRMPVTLDLLNSSLENALNDGVRQVPGLGWAVREVNLASREPKANTAGAEKAIPGCNLALFDGVGWLETSWTLGVVTAPR